MSLSRTRRLRIVPGLLQTILQPNPAEKKMLPFWGNLPMELVYGILEFANYKNRNGMLIRQIKKNDPRCLMLKGRELRFFKPSNGYYSINWRRNADRRKFVLLVKIQNDAITTLTIEFRSYRLPSRQNYFIKLKTTYVI